MINLFNFVGIFSEIFLIGTVLLSWSREKSFDFHQDAFSYFGTHEKTRKIFNTGLFICAFLRLAFVGRVLSYFSLWSNPLVLIVYAGGCLTILISSVIPWDKHERIHTASAKGITVCSVLFILLIGLALVKNYLSLAIFNLIMFIVMAILALNFLVTKKTNGVPQIIFLALIIIWDNVMTLKLLNVI